MTSASLSSAERVMAQLRANLHSAEIVADQADLDGIQAKGFLSRLALFEQIIADLPSDTVPDYLHGWGDQPVGHDTDTAVPAQLQGRSIAQLARQFRSGELSPTTLLNQLLQQIATHDSQHAAFQLVLAERAQAQAQAAEQAFANGYDLGPLQGIPIAVKDLYAIAGQRTTAGSAILADWVPDYSATAVERLEAVGAVIIGKTRMSEFAYSPGSNNGHYGPTPNPWNPAYDAGGSSSGSAAAVATGMAVAALGSDTGGSIRIPAAFCGIVGMKPTFGRNSLYGAVPLSWSLDHAGTLTRTVEDAAVLLEAMAGPDPRDPRTRQRSHFRVPADLYDGVKGLRIGVVRHDGTNGPLGSPAALAAWQQGLDALHDRGAILVELDLPWLDQLRVITGAVMALEAVAYHLHWLRTKLDQYAEFMRQRILAACAYGAGALPQAQQARAILRQRGLELFDRIDLLSTPSHPDSATPLGTPGLTTFTNPMNGLGWPAISIPVGVSAEGLPFGMQIAGRPWDDATVLRVAQTVEDTLGGFTKQA